MTSSDFPFFPLDACLRQAGEPAEEPLYRLLLWIGQGMLKVKMKEHRLVNLIRLHVFARRFFSSGTTTAEARESASEVAQGA